MDRPRSVDDIKSSAWKEALGLFLCVAAVTACWGLISKAKLGLSRLLLEAAIPAIITYVVKRKDWFD
jgi:hypothetical protein